MNELYHHGIKGQKWGVRKKRETTNSGRKTVSNKNEVPKKKKKKLTADEKKALTMAALLVIGNTVLMANAIYDSRGPGNAQKHWSSTPYIDPHGDLKYGTGRETTYEMMSDMGQVPVNRFTASSDTSLKQKYWAH